MVARVQGLPRRRLQPPRRLEVQVRRQPHQVVHERRVVVQVREEVVPSRLVGQVEGPLGVRQEDLQALPEHPAEVLQEPAPPGDE